MRNRLIAQDISRFYYRININASRAFSSHLFRDIVSLHKELTPHP